MKTIIILTALIIGGFSFNSGMPSYEKYFTFDNGMPSYEQYFTFDNGIPSYEEYFTFNSKGDE